MPNREDVFQRALNEGHSAAWDQDWRKAAAAYRQALQEFPDQPRALNSLGLALYQLGEFEEALRIYQRVATLSPNDPLAFEKVAQISERVGDLSVKIAGRMGMSAPEVETLRLGASLHDIGKIGVGDGVLRKNGPLSDAERLAIQAHPVLGARILQPVAFLADHLSIVELHHEQPDGRGYPHGLSGDRIPLSARIVHLADAFDAMTSDRPYRASRGMSEAVEEIIANRGTQFDEAVVDAFLEVVGDQARLDDQPRRPTDLWSGALTPPSTVIR